ncbi:FGGY family carbohydrate kinase [Streptomyces sp. MK5]|uniref:FGGY family carbohydrate kinase n=1 Tax=Streptomyces sp. MK5 TaxID=3064253 RepID=UPI0027425143|nr:FGGY family carbohydrate kinase [Streptomyces sp. MK5]
MVHVLVPGVRPARGAGRTTVVAVGVSGMGPCVLLTDEHDTPLRPAILYGVDTRSVRQIERIEERLGAEEIIRRSGSALSTQAARPKIAWIAEEEPELYARARRLHMPSSWLVRQLTGAYVLDHHSASQCTPLPGTAVAATPAPGRADRHPLAPTARRTPGVPAGPVSSRASSMNSRHHAEASISKWPGPGRAGLCSRTAERIRAPSRPTRTPLLLDVPMSTPMTALRGMSRTISEIDFKVKGPRDRRGFSR